MLEGKGESEDLLKAKEKEIRRLKLELKETNLNLN